MELPIQLVYFWYTATLISVQRIWKNTLSIIEEDLAVGLMLHLLFTPLFHDSSITGRVMSFFFRLSRIFVGFLAYIFATIFIWLAAVLWWGFFILLVFPQTRILGILIFLFGISLFIDRVVLYPRKKVKEIGSGLDIWKTTKLSLKDVSWDNLIKTQEVNNYLKSLELNQNSFANPNLSLNNDYYQAVINLAREAQAKYITPAFFWAAQLLTAPGIENQLLKLNMKPQDFTGALKFMEHKRAKWRAVYIWDEDFGVKHLKGTNRGWLSAPTPNLDSVSEDLTKQAASQGFPDFIGRKQTADEVVNILSTQSGRNVLIVAPPGSGKSNLVNYLAKMIVTGDAPKALANKRLVSLDLTRLLAGVRSEGDLADKIKNVFDEVKFIQDIIIFIDEIQNLGIGDAGSEFNLYSLMLPQIESNTLQFLATTEPENYAKIVEKNGAFSRLFTKVDLPPATPEETIHIVQEQAVDLYRSKKIEISYKAVSLLVELSERLIHDRVLPDSALSILNEAESQASNGQITTQTIKDVIGKRVNVPVQELGTAEKSQLLNLEEKIHQKMIDQTDAVSAISNTLRRAATDLREQNRPIGSFLFVGPTGVGKTELAKTLAEVYFKDKAAFVRFDMSEYQTPEAVNRLLGDSQNPGELTEAVKNKPYSLILLDEFEKADSKITTLFLQVLDDGRLTDSSGKTIDFTSTIIIATSNAGSLLIAQGLGHGETPATLKPKVNDELLKVFKPELVNRFDDVVIFKPLSPEDLQKIVILKLKELQTQLQDQGYLIAFTPELIMDLAKKGFDPVLGARPLRRLIQDTLEARMSKLMLENTLVKGQLFRAGTELIR